MAAPECTIHFLWGINYIVIEYIRKKTGAYALIK